MVNTLSAEVKAKVNIAADIPASIADIAGVAYADIVNIFLNPVPTFEKFMCTLQHLQMFENVSLPKPVLDLMFPYNANCEVINVDYNSVLGYNVLQEVNSYL